MDEEGTERRLREGSVVAGKYALTHTLGRGGMGLVMAATHLQLDRRVAIKFLLPEHLAKEDVVGRFTREARSAAKIQSDHVAHVLDVGVDDGTPYMVMEYLEGEDLKQVLARRGPLEVEEAVRYVMHACEALTEAHGLGIVHRDLKPANLFLANRPNGRTLLKVLDFGISKMMNPETETQLTLTSRAVGTPSYMSPEQLTASRTLDGRADVWSLGVVLYELLTKRRPFYGDSMPSLVALILKGRYDKLDSVRPDLPPLLVEIVHQCLELDVEKRIQTVSLLAQALAPFEPTDSISAVEGIPRASTSAPQVSPSVTPGATVQALGDASEVPVNTGVPLVVTPRSRPPRRALLALSAGVGMLVVFGVGAAVVLRGSAAPPAGVAGASLPAPPPSGVDAPPAPDKVAAADPADSAGSVGSVGSVGVVTRAPVQAPAPPAAASPVVPTRRLPSSSTSKPGSVKAAAPGSATTAAKAVPECHLESYFDPLGDKHFKEVCP